MTRKLLVFGFYVLAISLLLLTMDSCVSEPAPLPPYATREARRTAVAAETSEVATAVVEVETYEAGATAEAEATANAGAVSSGVGCTPGAWCIVKGQFDVVVGYVADSNEVNISFPADGGAVSGDFRFSWIYEASDNEGWFCRARIGSVGTLSGDFDPDSAELEGTVYDFRSTLEVLEGCEEIEVEAYPPTTQWSATYDWTTGVVEGGVVFPDEVTPFHGATVSEEPSNPPG